MSRKNNAMIWLPVFLLPAANLLSFALNNHASPSPAAPVLIGAAAEELFYRWFLLGKALLKEERIKPVVSVILVSILFGLMHLWNLRAGAPFSTILFQVFFAFCFSIWAGAVVWKSTFLIPLLAHVLLNLTAVDGGVSIPLITGLIVLLDGILLMGVHEAYEVTAGQG